MRQRQSQSWLMIAATKAVKYFLLSLAGCTVTYIVSMVLEVGLLPPPRDRDFGTVVIQSVRSGALPCGNCCDRRIFEKLIPCILVCTLASPMH